MSIQTPTTNYRDLIERLPPDSALTLRNVSWEDYEGLLEGVGEAAGLRISYERGTLQIMTLSPEHESYTKIIERLVDLLSIRLRIKILFFGSATMKRERNERGSEPDACFYVQNADRIGKNQQIDFSKDPPPDIVVEVDVHHDSQDKFSIYAALGVPEIWRYDERALTIHHLKEGQYIEAESSLALPMLDARVLTDFLNRSQREDQYEILLAFENWLQRL
ncbi:MAG: Uma2 family endonuclease [Acidobacteriota bacterium]